MKITRKRTHRTTAAAESLEPRTLFAAITFASNVNFVAGTAPVALAAADFNGDGNMDLAVADHATDKVDIFFGNGAGAFSAGPVLPLSAPPTAIITGDFNGDGRSDIAVGLTAGTGQTTTSVDVFLNTGGGTFGLGQITTVETGATPGEPVALAAGDFNDDKHLDLAVTGYTAQSINILDGAGSGTFAAPVTYLADQYPTAITSADFTLDGYPDLAVTSTSVNVFAGTLSDGSASNQVSLLLDSSTGTFSAGPNLPLSTNATPSGVTSANLTVASTPGLLVTNTDGTVSVLTDTSGTFDVSATATISGGATGVAAGDFNLDGYTDFVAAGGASSLVANSSSVTVEPGAGSGTLGTALQLPTGSNPVGVVVADFNNDGKPDIATANENDGTVSILLNTTTLTPIGTGSSVLSDNALVPAGNAVTFTATIHSVSVSPLPGESLPTGTVKFFDNGTLLGTSTIVAGTNQAQFVTSDLIVGSHRITVSYSGDPAYAASSSARITQVINPTATEGPDLVGTQVFSTLPGIVAPGETGTVKITITNQGNTPAVGPITNSMYLSLDSTLDGGDIPVTFRGSLTHANLHLQPNKSITLVGTVTIPMTAGLASYSLLTQVDSTGSLAESVSTNDTVVSPGMYAVSDVFGTVAGRAGVVLHVTDNNAATFRLTGPGNGTVNVGDAGVQIVLDGTTSASSLIVTTSPGSPAFIASDLSTDSPIGTIRAGTMNVTNTITLPGGATSITIASAGSGATGNAITIGAGAATAIRIASVPGTNLTATGGIKSLSVGYWGSGNVSAGWIGSLHSTQQFIAGVTVSGSGARNGIALQSATIGGIATGSWNVIGNIGRISLVATPPSALGWTLNDTGTLRSLSILSTFYGCVFATSIGSVTIHGDLTGEIASDTNLASVLVTGNLNDAKVLAAITAPGTLGSIRVTGSATNSLIAAGAGDGVPPITLNAGGTIRSVSVLGTVDAQTKFLAAVLPRRATLDRGSVTPKTDPHFQV